MEPNAIYELLAAPLGDGALAFTEPPLEPGADVAPGRVADAAYRHVASALARLADGGRLVAITGANFSSDHPAWAAAFVRLQERGRVVFTAAAEAPIVAPRVLATTSAN